jgi:cytochrome oxidase Cu insertion factor (SCO1/SenC/PrrC family)
MKIVKMVLAVIFSVGCAMGTNQSPAPGGKPDLPPTELSRVSVGTAAPDFTLISKDKEPVTLSSFEGDKNVVLVFYRGYW